MSNRFADSVQQVEEQSAPEGTDDAKKTALGEEEGDTTRLNVRVPTPLYERFKEKVESEGRTMTWVVLRAIRDYLAK